MAAIRELVQLNPLYREHMQYFTQRVDICVEIKLQFLVCRGVREVLLSGYGRVSQRDVVSEFELKTWPRCRDRETRPLSLGEKQGTRRVDGVEGSTTLPDAVDAKAT